MEKINRRQFVGTALAATGALALGAVHEAEAAGKPPKKPTDKVALGKTGIKVSLVGMGTGSIGWNHESNQTRLGHEAFNRLVRHAYDSGITFFDAADQYGSNPYMREALRGIPREKYVLQTKTNSREPDRAKEDIDRFLKELGVDYIDSLIVHCVTEADWTTRYRGVMDVMEEARQKGKIRAHGVTCHSFVALQAAYESDWVQINQVRWNPKGAHMDADVETARALFAKMRKKGQGMIGMKVVGQGDIIKGDLASYRDTCYRFQIESGVVDAFVVGLEKQEHVDQMLHGTQLALNEVDYRFASPRARTGPIATRGFGCWPRS
jgi:predicted aldo/keto reductase-like oxidoreductase